MDVGDNNRGKECSINTVHLQLGGIERDCPNVEAAMLSPPIILTLGLFQTDCIDLRGK